MKPTSAESSIEVYIRPSGDLVLLNLYVPAAMRKRFIAGMESGSFDDAPINFEISILPEWSTDSKEQAHLSKIEPVHIRVPLAAINVCYTE